MLKQKLIASLIAFLLRALGLTLRIHLEDRCGLREGMIRQPTIWAFWHNRMLILPIVARRFYPHRHGSVLTSASRDGEILAGVMRRFGIGSVRGSSSRRGSTAVRELAAVLESGGDVAITPDGPRGPRYKLGPGIIFLSQKTSAPVIPIHVHYSRAVRLKSWDRFMIPLPFSRVRVVFDELHQVPRENMSQRDFEVERARLEQLLHPGDE